MLLSFKAFMAPSVSVKQLILILREAAFTVPAQGPLNTVPKVHGVLYNGELASW